jgi:hypothetical protein
VQLFNDGVLNKMVALQFLNNPVQFLNNSVQYSATKSDDLDKMVHREMLTVIYKLPRVLILDYI